MYLLFDTETNGLPKDWKAPVEKTDNWPRLVQLAWLLFDEQENEISRGNYIIKPVGFEITSESAAIHRIPQERALSEGHDLVEVLNKFQQDVEKAEFIIAHNIEFDEKIIKAELIRNNIDNFIDTKKKICTMISSKDYCQLRSRSGNGFKAPTLGELHYRLFNSLFKDAHDAMVDTDILAKSFFELKKLNIINPDKDFSEVMVEEKPEESQQNSLF